MRNSVRSAALISAAFAVLHLALNANVLFGEERALFPTLGAVALVASPAATIWGLKSRKASRTLDVLHAAVALTAASVIATSKVAVARTNQAPDVVGRVPGLVAAVLAAGTAVWFVRTARKFIRGYNSMRDTANSVKDATEKSKTKKSR